jgi:hypothetical protein
MTIALSMEYVMITSKPLAVSSQGKAFPLAFNASQGTPLNS